MNPIAVIDVELTQDVPDLSGGGFAGAGSALVLVRVHSRPIGVAELELPPGGLGADGLASAIWRALGAEVRQHLVADALEPPEALTPAGLGHTPTPRCLEARAAARAAAIPMTVVIATRERPAMLAACLDALDRMDYPACSLIVVDNAPVSADTRELVAERAAGGADIAYVSEPRPGLARAHNAGLEHVATPLVAFTDDDVLVDPFWAVELAAAFALGPEVGCVTGSILPVELETEAQIWIERNARFNKGYARVVFDPEACRRDPLLPYAAGRFGSGANMAFRTDALLGIGGFDPIMGAGTRSRGGDDLCAFFDVVSAGHTLVYEPAALVRHNHRADLDGLRVQMYGYGVGLGAYLARTVARRPTRALDLAAQAVTGARHFRSERRSPAHGRATALTRELGAAERRGLVRGPAAYALERLAARRERGRR